MCFAIKRAAKSKLAVLSLLGFVDRKGEGEREMADTNCFWPRLQLTYVIYLNSILISFASSSGAAAVFTFIRFGSFWFCSFASENSKHPAKLATSLLADLSGLLGLASWLADWLPAYHDYCDYWPRLGGSAKPQNTQIENESENVLKRRQNRKRK